VEVGTLEGVLGFVEQGLGIAVLPRTFAEYSARRVGILLLEEFWPDRFVRVYLVSASERSTSQGLGLFLRHCQMALNPPQGSLPEKQPRGSSRSVSPNR
jgi:DNA-binding transcriptional LysR family regulator